MRSPLVGPALAGLVLALTGCSFSVGGADAVTQSELEKQVAGMYTADDPEGEITAECDGELKAEVDATQDCVVATGGEESNIHVTVTEIDGDTVSFENQLYVPAEKVAETIKSSLEDQKVRVDTVECDAELIGEVDETTSCTAAPAQGDGAIEVTVTQVDGLLVNFDYQVVS